MAFLDLSWKTFRPAEGFYTSEVPADKPLPVRTFLPASYEARYPYPLLVFFHGKGGSEEQIMRLAPKLSRRNYISIGLRGPVPSGPGKDGRPGYSWGDAADGTLADAELLEDYMLQAVEQTRLNYHVHSERIYLAGFAEGAELAYRLALTFPEKIGGVISLNGAMPRQDRPLFRFHLVRSLRIFIAHGIADPVVPLSMARQDYRVFYAAGASVQMHTYPTTHKLHPDMLRDVNRWIIDRCNGE